MATFPLPTADVTGASIRFGGSWSYGNIGGHNYALVVGGSSRIDTKIVTGSGTNTLQVTIFSNSGTQPINVYFDGVVQTRPTLSSSGAWVVATLASNIPAGTNVTLQSLGGFYVDTDYGLNITDGTTPTLGPPDGFGTVYPVASAPFSANSRTEGGFVNFNGLNYNFFDGSNIDMSMRFATNASQIKAWLYRGGSTYVVYQDGVQLGAAGTLVNDGTVGLFTFATGLTGTHEYEIHVINSSGGHLLTLTYFMLVGGTLTPASYQARDQYGFWGDSITQGDITSSDSRVGYVYKFGQSAGVGVVNAGHNSWTSANILFDLTTTLHNVGLGSNYLKRWCLMVGVNDINNAISTSTYQSNVTAIINALVAAYPSARGTILKILPLAAGANETARPSYNAVLAAAIVASTGGGTNVDLWDVSTGPGGTYTSSDTIDGTHPTSTGYDKIHLNFKALALPAGAGSGGASYNSLTIGIRMDL